MAIANGELGSGGDEGKGWGLCHLPFFGGGGGGGGGGRGGGAVGGSSSSNSLATLSLTQNRHHRLSGGEQAEGGPRRNPGGASSVSAVVRSLLPARRRLRLDPTSKLYFPCESFHLVVEIAAFAATFSCSFGIWLTNTIKDGSFSIFFMSNLGLHRISTFFMHFFPVMNFFCCHSPEINNSVWWSRNTAAKLT